MRIIPVIDVMSGVVVRGIGGRRKEYEPLVSQLTSSIDPVEVARVLIDTFHPREIYLADLDAIEGAEPCFEVYRAILQLGVKLWVDAGVREVDRATRLAANGCDVIAGLETIPSPQELGEIVAAIGIQRTIFSLDFRNGEPLRKWFGASGARILVTLLNAMQEREARRGVAAACLGGGEAVSLAVERASS